MSNLWGIPKVWRWQNWSEALIREEIEQFIRVLNNPEWENVLFDFFIKDLTYTEIEKQRGYAWGVPKNITALACVRLAQLWTCKKYIKEFKEENN